MSPLALRRYRAERLLRKEFTGLRSKVLAIVRSRLRARGVTLDVADLEACYAQAWQGLYAAVLGGEQVESPAAWLVLVTFRRAIDESRSVGRRRLADGEERSVVCDPDLAGALDDRARLQQLLEGLRSGLSERECQAASLCYLQGLSRAQAAGQMGISEARMRKLMEGAGRGRPGVAGKVGELLETISGGGWCEQQASLMRAFAFGILDPDGERHALARIHQRECPACRAYVLSLRGLAAILPPLPLPLVAKGGVVAAAASLARGRGMHLLPRASGTAGTSGTAGAGTGSGWVMAGAPLAAKLTAAGVLALVLGGGGVALLASARERPTAQSAAHAGAHTDAWPVEGAFLHQALAAPRTVGHGASGHTVTGAGSLPSHLLRRHSGVAAGATREFGPERAGPVQAHGGAATAPGSTAPTPRPPTGASREFGFE